MLSHWPVGSYLTGGVTARDWYREVVDLVSIMAVAIIPLVFAVDL